MHTKNFYKGCPIQYTLKFLGGKWQMGILWNLKEKALRFSELKKQLPGITEKMLAQELRFFEESGMIQKKVFAEVPPKVEYSLTEHGKTLLPIIASIMEWGYVHLQDEKLRQDMFLTPVSIMDDIDKKVKTKTTIDQNIFERND